jgi:hypothetical protein
MLPRKYRTNWWSKSSCRADRCFLPDNVPPLVFVDNAQDAAVVLLAGVDAGHVLRR